MNVLAVEVFLSRLANPHPFKELGVNVGSGEKVRVLAIRTVYTRMLMRTHRHKHRIK